MEGKAGKPNAVGKDRIEQLRTEIEALQCEPEFQNLSRTFRHTLAQRLGIEEIQEGGLCIQTQLPVTPCEIVEGMGLPDPSQWPPVCKEAADIWNSPYDYVNVYSYSFW